MKKFLLVMSILFCGCATVNKSDQSDANKIERWGNEFNSIQAVRSYNCLTAPGGHGYKYILEDCKDIAATGGLRGRPPTSFSDIDGNSCEPTLETWIEFRRTGGDFLK